ncbi:hypothetical protein [Stenotrophomonas sp. YIM B06876]|uniref:hypothetical protein n=1 Tax=Stenotrophomonas sp. YIM B06876 TaxID=3060211 RepID=UPI00273A4BCB|nr:hypothetical protein [Stenotrophomonas sp. YIM B06876]
MRLQPVYRIVVFVPPAHLDALKRGILAVDTLAAGGYEHGMWESAPGYEQYRALAATTPVQGRAGERVREPTVRLEFCIPRDPERLQRLLQDGIAAHHPWNTPAVFVDETRFMTP